MSVNLPTSDEKNDFQKELVIESEWAKDIFVTLELESTDLWLMIMVYVNVDKKSNKPLFNSHYSTITKGRYLDEVLWKKLRDEYDQVLKESWIPFDKFYKELTEDIIESFWRNWFKKV